MKQLVPNKLSLILVLFVFFLAGCKKNELFSDEYDKLRENRWKWTKQGIFDYEIDESKNCFCMVAGNHHLIVVAEEIVSTTNKDSGEEVPEPEKYFKTIDGLFAYIEASLKRKPYLGKIEYDPTYGFPTKIYFDFDKNMADEEDGYVISGFQKN